MDNNKADALQASVESPRDHEVLGNRLKEAREFLGLSQDAVARAMNLSRATISAIEIGKRKVTGLELRDLAKLYRTPVADLLGESPSASTDDVQARSLYRATKDLTVEEQSQVLRFAEFLRSAGRAPEKQSHDE